MHNSNHSAWQTGQIPQWKEQPASDVAEPFHPHAEPIEWEANYLLPQLVGAAEPVLKRFNSPFTFANRSDRHVQQ